MPKQTVEQKSPRATQPAGSPGAQGIVLAPPAYGIDLADNQPVEAQGVAIQRREAPAATRDSAPGIPHRTGLPDALKSGIESLSGISMDDVRVRFNSSRPAQLQALAYTQGTEIHVAPGQARHLPHEAWHVVQQKQGRVKATMQLKDGVTVNCDAGLEHEADVMGERAQHQVMWDGECAATSNPVASPETKYWQAHKKISVPPPQNKQNPLEPRQSSSLRAQSEDTQSSYAQPPASNRNTSLPRGLRISTSVVQRMLIVLGDDLAEIESAKRLSKVDPVFYRLGYGFHDINSMHEQEVLHLLSHSGGNSFGGKSPEELSNAISLALRESKRKELKIQLHGCESTSFATRLQVNLAKNLTMTVLVWGIPGYAIETSDGDTYSVGKTHGAEALWEVIKERVNKNTSSNNIQTIINELIKIIDTIEDKLAVAIKLAEYRDALELRNILGRWQKNRAKELENAVIIPVKILQTPEKDREDIRKLLSTVVKDPIQTDVEQITWIKDDETSDEETSVEELKDSLENFRAQLHEDSPQKKPPVPAFDFPTIVEENQPAKDENISELADLEDLLKGAIAAAADLAQITQDLHKK